MRGHLKNRNGNYTIVIYHGMEFDPASGKNKKKYTWHSANQLLGRKAGKKEAEDLLLELLKQVSSDTFVIPDKLSFGEFLMSHWLPHMKNLVRANTYRRYEGIVKNHLVPNLGGIQVAKIKPITLQKLYTTLLEDGNRKDGKEGALSARSVHYVHTTIHKALGQAVIWRMIIANSADAVELPKIEKKEMLAWDTIQVKNFLTAVKGHRHYALYLMAFSTGMRQSEILGLRWQDVDLNKGIVAVRQGLHYAKGKFEFKEPKTKKSKRTITLPPGTVKALKEHDRQQKEAYMKLKEKSKEKYTKKCEEYPGLIFRSKVGTPINPRNLIRHFEKVQEGLDMPSLTFHEIRHTHATLLLQAGEHVKVVSERLGHATVAITMDLYSHVLPNMQAGAADKIEEQLFSD